LDYEVTTVTDISEPDRRRTGKLHGGNGHYSGTAYGT
jgi:hypothetical protein